MVDLVSVSGGEEALVQIGFSTGITDTPEQPFVRKPLNLSLAVDVSGSMSGDRIAAVRQALGVLVDQLRSDDVFSLVAFERDAHTLIGPTSGDEKERLREAIDSLVASGGTNIGAGLDRSAELVRENLTSDSESLHRVMLFTDMHPNRGMSDGRTFVRVLQDYADEGIGVSSFGVGVHFGADLANQIAEVRGGNYFHLETPDKVRRVFDRDFDLMVTPLAYDLEISLIAPLGYEIANSYGLAGSETTRCAGVPSARCLGIKVPTVFLSRGGGGIYLRLIGEPSGGSDFLSHVTYESSEGESTEAQSEASLSPDDVRVGSEVDPALRMGAQLINVIDAMRRLGESRGAHEELAWAALRALRAEAEAIGPRADSLFREAMMLSQAITVARQLR
jgi:Ca-activated chloride channel family protein